LKVLALNWRDPGHPEAGGAEVHLSEILARWVSRGAEVTWIASSFPGAASETTIRGMRVLRRGSWWNANWAAAREVHRLERQGAYDLIVEDINKIPYFAPLYAKAPVLAVVPHLFGTTVFAEASWPIACVVWAHEIFLPALYGRVPFLVISESTGADLGRRGIPERQIVVSHCGLDHSRYSPGGTKSEIPSVVYVGRLRRYKGVDALLDAFARLSKELPAARLSVLGAGPYRPALEARARRLGIADRVEFTGFIPAEEKVGRLRAAWVSALSSPKEGWGLTVVESNACGTPVIASRSPGLVDSVRDGETGLLVPHGDVAALTAALRRVLTDASLRERLAAEGLRWSRRFSWDRAAEEAWQMARSVVERRELPRSFIRPDDAGSEESGLEAVS
jgi:glycosyltransferase involved in cell wall biosynthesis